MKPLGVRLGVGASGSLTVGVTKPTYTEDKVWDAVREAINEGWTPKRFRAEVADAWETAIKDDARDAIKAVRKEMWS